MHSIYQRVNAISAHLSSCLIALLVAITLSSFVIQQGATGVVEVQPLRIWLRKPNPYQPREEFAFFKFDLEADLTPLFHWNTKQVFLYLAAEYQGKSGHTNEVVIWDRIVQRKEDAHLSIEDEGNKYDFKEISKTFKNATSAHFVVKYNIMPYVGVLTYGEAARTIEPVTFPKITK